jgi:hypothetical protein
MLKAILLATGLFLIAGHSAVADSDITVLFDEAAPKDSFTIRNEAACDIRIAELTIDLAGSAGDLIFDTTPGGEGLSVYQPFELVAGGDKVSAVTEVSDGSRSVTFSFNGLEPGEFAMFTIDVDDRLTDGPMGQTMVAGSEIEGAAVRMRLVTPGGPDRTLATAFAGTRATLNLGPCVVS